MRAYQGTFKKKNGEARQMRFVKLSDLPEAVLSSVVKGTGRTTNLAEGMELVWDLDTHTVFACLIGKQSWTTLPRSMLKILSDSEKKSLTMGSRHVKLTIADRDICRSDFR